MKTSSTINPRILVGKITATAAGAGGKVRCTVANHGLLTDHKIFIEGVQGTTEANGYFTITKIDDNNFDLTGTTYVNTFTNEGYAYKIQVVKAVLGSAATTFVTRFETRYFGSALVTDSKSFVKSVSNTEIEIFRSDSTYAILLDFVKSYHSESTARVLTVTIEHFNVVERFCNISVNQNEIVTSGIGNQIVSSDGRTVSGAIDPP